MDISIIIPAYNEKNYIKETISSIQQWMPNEFSYEIIVVDHGSTDGTADIARKLNAKVINGSALKTIAALRNFGVANSIGNFLFFIDADITFSEKWSKNIGSVIASLKTNDDQICGSLPQIPDSANFFVRSWFNPKSLETAPNYIGSCHLILSRTLFVKVNGFPDHMKTSEDFTLCKNAKELGAQINANPNLTVTHNGAPKTIKQFIKSEQWHGLGDWTNTSTILRSKAAIFTIIFIFLHILLAVALFSTKAIYPVLLSIACLCALSSAVKFRKYGQRHVLINTLTFYLYFLGRGLSLASALRSKGFSKRSREN